ncbi:hypothetical protein [Alkalibacillus salilacus]|uniref:Uncharacterized protein n=1 Tax=Alkalibacillus salilacus TaxID=284582 RepID=A0ABT9VIT2_9BACI|nr:hypothetical protein [Alkalibacillus salilacus]MDQ0160867.1 hypothetical protein [Alkalibacillus salilacus]
MESIMNILEPDGVKGIILFGFFILSTYVFIKLVLTWKIDEYEKWLMSDLSIFQHDYWKGVKVTFFLSYTITRFCWGIELNDNNLLTTETILYILLYWMVLFLGWTLFIISKRIYVSKKNKSEIYLEMEEGRLFYINKRFNNGTYLILETGSENPTQRIVNREQLLNRNMIIHNE